MIQIKITKDFKEDHMTRTAGEKLRTQILEATGKSEKVEIDFTGVTIASTSFFDEAFAKLVSYGWTKGKFVSSVFLKNIHPKDLMILQRLCDDRGMK